MTDGSPGTSAELADAMQCLRRDANARRNAVPATDAFDKALAAEERSARQVMDLARLEGKR